MYKDKEKQKEAQRERTRRYRALHNEGVTCAELDRALQSILPEHLPLDVQRTINRLTTLPDGTVDEQARANRTAIAISYQHYRPDRYHNTGVALSGHNYAGVVYAKEASIFNEG